MSLVLATSISACTQQTHQAEATASANDARAAVDAVYAGFAAGDIAMAVSTMAVSTMAPEIEWNEAQGNPYSDQNPYIGPDAVVSGLFTRLGGEWEGFTATPEEFVSEGGRIVVFGRYKGIYRANGKSLDAPFAHSWTVTDGKIVRFQQYTDTAGQADVMTVDE
jgi:hypothetical protein